MKEYNEQVVETLDDAGCIIANKNMIIDNLQAKIAELEGEVERLSKLAYIGEHQFDDCTWKHRHGELRAQLAAAQEQIANETAEAIAEYCRKQDHYCLATEIESGAWKEFKK